jgi:glycosyltransferase involved in cell wall biosynthesis
VLGQTFRDYEIIVSDDSASPSIRAICDSFFAANIRYRANPTTLGIALNLRAAISEARGNYLAILNDDDAWEPSFLARLVEPLDQSSARVIAFCDPWIMREDGQLDPQKTAQISAEYGRRRLPAGEVPRLDDLMLAHNGTPLAMGSVLRKDALDFSLLTAEVSGAYDLWLCCLLAATRRPGYFLPEHLSRYRMHAQMETHRKAPDKSENLVFIFERLRAMNTFPERADLLAQKYSQALYIVGLDYLEFDRVGEARGYFLRAFKTNRSLRSAVRLVSTFFPKPLRAWLVVFQRR